MVSYASNQAYSDIDGVDDVDDIHIIHIIDLNHTLIPVYGYGLDLW